MTLKDQLEEILYDLIANDHGDGAYVDDAVEKILVLFREVEHD